MGSIAFDYLADSFLLNKNSIKKNFREYTENQIFYEIENYRKHCLANFEALVTNTKAIDSNLKVIAKNTEPLSVNQIMQSALYLENFIVYDPFFILSAPEDKIQKTANEFFKKDSTPYSLKDSALDVAKDLKYLQPLVAGDFLKLLPFSHFFEPPEKIPMYFPGLNYDNGQPGID
jgi:hypothetical protein